jgi:hypothetical protein
MPRIARVPKTWWTTALCSSTALACSSPTASNPPPPVVVPSSYVLRLATTAEPLGSVIISVTGSTGDPVILASGATRVRSFRVGTVWRAMFIGPLTGIDLVQLQSPR